MRRIFPQIMQRTSVIAVVFLFNIVVFSIIAGCIAGNASSPETRTTRTATPEVIIPVDSPSAITYTNSLKKDSSPPAVYEGLVIKDRNGKFNPSLAERWEVSPDARVWTFHLVNNATWHDGVPFTCADVKFTRDYMKANNLTMGFVLNDVKSVECTDDHTVVFTLKTSYSGFLDQVSHTPGITIAPRHFWENIGDPQGYIDKTLVGTGPFIFTKSEPGYVQLKRNNAYYGKVPAISGVVLKLITNPDSQVLALKNGEIDVVSGIPPAVAESLKNEKDISTYTIQDSGAYEIAFNMKGYPSNISGFRQAMSHAVDRETIRSLIGTGRPTTTTFLIPSLAGDYVNPADVGMYDYDLAKAQKMLAAAGFTKNHEGFLIGPDGKVVTITLPTGSDATSGKKNSAASIRSGTTQKIITVLKNDWAKLGITLTPITYDDRNQYRAAVNANPVFIDTFPVQLHDDANAFINFAITPTQEVNYYNYNNPEYNSLVSQMKNTSDQAEIKKLAYRMQDILAKDIPTIPVCTTDTIVAFRNDRFIGWDVGPGYHSTLDPQVLVNLTPVQA